MRHEEAASPQVVPISRTRGTLFHSVIGVIAFILLIVGEEMLDVIHVDRWGLELIIVYWGIVLEL